MELAARLPAAVPSRGARYGFQAKAAAAIVLIALADWLFFPDGGGSTFGGWAIALLATVLALVPTSRRIAAGAAALFAAALAWDPSILAAILFWASLSLAVLLPKARADDGWRWLLRLAWQAARTIVVPFADAQRLRAARHRRGGIRIVAHLPALVLPIVGSALFLLLFAAANPLIGDAFARVDVAVVVGTISVFRIAFWTAVALPLWALLRPRVLRFEEAAPAAPPIALPGVSAASVTLSLLAFNLVFALENGLDLAYLWSGAALPAGMTFAGYAHRGAYPLIATALLAGLFVLVTLRPGSALAESRPIRALVSLWIAQNVLLVASTVLRTLDYVEAYSLTRLRIAALIWMALVAIGLVLICWRLWKGRSDAWLINANCAVAALALAACAFVDLGAVAAQWNVRHAREAGGPGQPLDICYMAQLGPSALLPLLELERRPIAPRARERVAWVRNLILDRMAARQDGWREWTAHDAWRRARAEETIASARLPRLAAARHPCDAEDAGALTPGPQR
jgi:hypothetical protein